MPKITAFTSIDYLVIGHLTRDITPLGPLLGGTAAYASLTAQAMGWKVGIVTSWGTEIPLGPLYNIPIANFPSEHSTTFENINTPKGRKQTIYHAANPLGYELIPKPWRDVSILHLGPVASEVDGSLIRYFPNALIGLSPQGWLRTWDAKGQVKSTDWPEASQVLQQVNATVISIEDVEGSEQRVEEMASACQILAVTEARNGSRLYWNGSMRRFPPPKMTEVDSVGAGDIFAAAFFIRLFATHDPWKAARFATQVAAFSVTRFGLESIPTTEEIQHSLIEVQ
jgi:sugar/nucleoside kinase (ribokinase family)